MSYVYIDSLFLLNLLMNLVIILCTALIQRRQLSITRFAAGAAVGAALVLIMLLCEIGSVLTVSLKVLLSVLIVYIAFRPRGWRDLLSALAAFFAASFLVGGLSMGTTALLATRFPGGGGYSSFGLYISGVLAMGLSLFLFWQKERNEYAQSVVGVTVSMEGLSAAFSALVDSGNKLYDPLSRCPVLVAELSSLRGLLPGELVNEIGRDPYSAVDTLSDVAPRFRLIPFAAVGAEEGILLGFRPDEVRIGNTVLSGREVVIGISRRPISRDGSYQGLVSPELLSRERGCS